MFGRKQAAQVIRNADLKPQLLVERVLTILSSKALLESMANAARSFARPEATQEIAAEIIKIAKVKS
jgi:UDP-N-acetylglucosamine:LPS N-acetylglucosamine transferase